MIRRTTTILTVLCLGLIAVLGCCKSSTGEAAARTTPFRADKTIAELGPADLAEYAENAWIRYGLNPISLRLLYRGSSMELHNASLLQVLADVFVEDWAGPAAVIYAYMMTDAVSMTKEQQSHFDRMFGSAMWIWGLSMRKDGQSVTTLGDIYSHPELFEYDMYGFHALVNSEVSRIGTLAEAASAVYRLAGIMSESLMHSTKGKDIDENDIFNGVDLVETENYAEWLNQPASTLPEIKKE